jgi:hypothetical protein
MIISMLPKVSGRLTWLGMHSISNRCSQTSGGVTASHNGPRGVMAQGFHESIVLSGGPDRDTHMVFEAENFCVSHANAP